MSDPLDRGKEVRREVLGMDAETAAREDAA